MKKIFKYQIWHFIILLALISLLIKIFRVDPGFLRGELFSIYSLNWAIITLASAVIHQLYVLICWRSELHFNSISKIFGDKGFLLFKFGFFLLILSRPASILFLAISNRDTFYMDNTLAWIISIVLFVPCMYLAYSLRKYFGIDRAFGIDHFYPDKYRNVDMVKKGIFKITPNAMYIFGFLLLWIPGFLLKSKLAILMALFHHTYIWAHYYFTELPDMKKIYAPLKKRSVQTEV